MKLISAILLFCFAICANTSALAQFSSIKVNALGLATTNINIGVDLEINKKTTINIPISVNPFSFGDTKVQYIAVQPGIRLWNYQNYIGHFWGIYTSFAKFETTYKGSYSNGLLGGVGASYGYSIMLNTRWNIEFEIGASILYARYDHGDIDVGIFDDEIITHYNRIFLSPSKACISFSYLF